VLPALLLTIAACALGGLALLPDRAGPSVAVLASAATSPPPLVTLHGDSERAAVLGRPPVRRAAPAPAAKAKPKPSPRPLRAARKRALLPAGPAGYVCPVAHPSFTDTWGDRRSGGRRHQGTDVMAPYGAPVFAVTSGVIETNYSSAGGIALYLRGTDGDEYYYAHNSRNAASSGERVAAGQLIAYVGTTGNARGGPAHVHFERHPGGGRAVDPYPFLVRACRG
jgi:murein DD-endopeptidase MepM/ murein hydrolase activator NlpD